MHRCARLLVPAALAALALPSAASAAGLTGTFNVAPDPIKSVTVSPGGTVGLNCGATGLLAGGQCTSPPVTVTNGAVASTITVASSNAVSGPNVLTLTDNPAPGPGQIGVKWNFSLTNAPQGDTHFGAGGAANPGQVVADELLVLGPSVKPAPGTYGFAVTWTAN